MILVTCEKAYFLLCCIFSVVLVGACGPHGKRVHQDEIVTDLLNKSRYDEAIALLEPELEKSPDNDYVKLRLASAYAGSVGLNIIDAYVVMEPMFSDQAKSGSQIERLVNATDPQDHGPPQDSRYLDSSTEVERFQRNLLQMAAENHRVLEVLTRLPYLKGDARERVARGIEVLRTIPSDSVYFASGQIYRGILSIVQFLNFFRDGLSDIATMNGASTSSMVFFCGLKIQPFLSGMRPALQYLTSGLDALHAGSRTSQGHFALGLRRFRQRLYDAIKWSESYGSLVSSLDSAHEMSKRKLCQ